MMIKKNNVRYIFIIFLCDFYVDADKNRLNQTCS